MGKENKSTIRLFLAIGLMILLMVACQSEPLDKDSGSSKVDQMVKTINEVDKVEIKEERFVTKIDESYAYFDEPVGTTVSYQGYLYVEAYEGDEYFYVIQNTYACECSGEKSFEGYRIKWEGAMPEEGIWVEIKGVLEAYTEDAKTYRLVNVSELEIQEAIEKTFVQ